MIQLAFGGYLNTGSRTRKIRKCEVQVQRRPNELYPERTCARPIPTFFSHKPHFDQPCDLDTGNTTQQRQVQFRTVANRHVKQPTLSRGTLR